MPVHEALTQAVQAGASDIYLSTGLPLMMRLHGRVQPLGTQTLSLAQLASWLAPHLPLAEARPETQALLRRLCQGEIDTSLTLPTLGRFRINAFAHTRGMAAVLRHIPAHMPNLRDIHAPAVLHSWLEQPRGLILVTGATGSGKSTTLAAMVNHLNQTQDLHLITLEDPIEFVHTPARCVIHQREVPGHSPDFQSALRAALRQDPDVMLVGELRDLATIRLALSAAETGHLVLGSLHTRSAAQTVERLVDVFPAEEKALVRNQLSLSLSAVVSQVLCPTLAGTGRVAAHEVLVATPAVRHLIRENKTAQLANAVQTGASAGMQTLAQSLHAWVQQGVISAAQAQRCLGP